MDNRKGSFATYIEDGLWKCGKSPNNAHFWIQYSTKNGYGKFYCKWCDETRWFPITQDSCLVAIGKTVYGVAPTEGENVKG